MRLLLIAMHVTAVYAACADILDRIAVTVGKQVITENQILRSLRITAFLDQKEIDSSAVAKRNAAQRLVDQILIFKEAADNQIPLANVGEVEPVLEQVKANYKGENRFDAALERYRITEDDLSAHLLAGIRALRFTDLRFRPEIQISEEELRGYYENLKRKGKVDGTFEASHEQVEELLTQDRTEQALDAWLEMTRAATLIVYREEVFR